MNCLFELIPQLPIDSSIIDEDALKNYKKILVPEINNGQLVKLLREKFLLPCIPFNKIQGTPITAIELKAAALDVLSGKGNI